MARLEITLAVEEATPHTS